jgi:hypothetical protein
MTPELYPHLAATDEVATFSLYDFGGRLSGFQQYRPLGEKKVSNKTSGKYWSYVPNGGVGVFGLESMDFSETVYLVGGLFKAATLHRLGYTALHVSAVSYKVLKPQLRLLRRHYVGIGDNDAEGMQFAMRYNGFTSPCDVDEMSDEDVHRMLTYGSKLF